MLVLYPNQTAPRLLASWYSLAPTVSKRKHIGRTRKGLYSQKGMFLPSKCLLESAFWEPLAKNPSQSFLPIEPCKTPSKNPSLSLFESSLENLLRTLLSLRRACRRMTALVCTLAYHWGQNDYLPNFYARRIILGNSMSLMCTKEKFQEIHIE